MKKTKNLVLLMLALVLFLVMPRTVFAKASEYDLNKGISTMDKKLYYLTGSTMGFCPSYMTDKKLKNLKVKSSNPSVCKVSIKKESSGPHVNFKMKKTGKATIYLSYTYNGKKYSNQARVKCIKYVNPLKSLKISGKESKGSFDSSKVFINCHTISGAKSINSKGAISIKMKKGFKLTDNGTYIYKKDTGHTNYKLGKSIKLSNIVYMAANFEDNEGYKGVVIWSNRGK